MEKSRNAKVIEGSSSKEITQSNTVVPWGSEVPFESQKG